MHLLPILNYSTNGVVRGGAGVPGGLDFPPGGSGRVNDGSYGTLEKDVELLSIFAGDLV